MLESEAEIFESQDYAETAKNGGKVANGVDLSQSATVLSCACQFHANGGGERHEEMLSHAVDEKPGDHQPVIG